MIVERPTYKKKYKKDNEELSGINVDIRTYNILCRYVLSTSSYMRMNHLTNLKKLVYEIDPSTYENDIEKLKRVNFLKKALEARLDFNLNNIDMILNHIISRLDFNIDFIDMDNLEISSDEVLWCHHMVSESLQYYFVYDYADKMIDICTRIKSSDYNKRGEVIKEFKNTIDDLKNNFRLSEDNDSLTDMEFSLKDGVFENVVKETYNIITNPSRRLVCGMQGLNEMVGGGFESGRVYMFLGITGAGKSIGLLNLIYQMKRYNKNYITKDPTKTPCIVLLTMENTVVETITRLYDMAIPTSNGMSNCNSADEVIQRLRNEGELSLNDESPIDIIIKYKANKSVDTAYLYEMTDNLSDRGYEVICVVQDHVKRIRSIDNSPDLRIELGDIVNEFKVFAADKDIPVISNCHLNRDATRIVEESNAKPGRIDSTMKLGKNNTGESLLMMDNIDCAIIMNPDYDQDNNKYMVYSLIKMRDKTNRTYMAQPFMYGSGIRLVEDVGGIPMFKDSLHMNHNINKIASVRTSSANVMSNISNLMSAQDDNSFADSGIYSFIPNDEQEEIDNDQSVEEAPVIPHPPIVCPIIFLPKIKNKPDIANLESFKAQLQSRIV